MLLPRAFLGCRRLVVSLPLLAVASHYYKSLAICLSGELRFYDLLTAPSECIEVDVVVWSPENVQVTPSLQQQCKSMTHWFYSRTVPFGNFIVMLVVLTWCWMEDSVWIWGREAKVTKEIVILLSTVYNGYWRMWVIWSLLELNLIAAEDDPSLVQEWPDYENNFLRCILVTCRGASD